VFACRGARKQHCWCSGGWTEPRTASTQQRWLPAPPLTDACTGTPLLVIDDTSQKYKDLNEFSCLETPTLSKLAAFSVSPKCVLDAVELQAQVLSR
jgi:hypothetical protein